MQKCYSYNLRSTCGLGLRPLRDEGKPPRSTAVLAEGKRNVEWVVNKDSESQVCPYDPLQRLKFLFVSITLLLKVSLGKDTNQKELRDSCFQMETNGRGWQGGASSGSVVNPLSDGGTYSPTYHEWWLLTTHS